jgi:hypothetical protein
MKKSFVLTCLGLSLLLCNCATVFTGSRQTIQIDSEPAGAEVLVDGVHMGETPTPVRVKKQFRGQLITLKADGYETKTIQPATDFNIVSVINLLNWPFWLIDAATGAMWTYRPRYYLVKLEAREREGTD